MIFVQHLEFRIGPFLVVAIIHMNTNVVKLLYIDGHYTNLDENEHFCKIIALFSKLHKIYIRSFCAKFAYELINVLIN